jgi:hypothetical protein
MQRQIITYLIFLETRYQIRPHFFSKKMFREENDIKDTVAASFSKPKLDFHQEIHQYLQTPPRQRLTGK